MTRFPSRPVLAAWPPAGGRTVLQWTILVLIIVVAWLAFKPSGEVQAGLVWDKANHAAAFAVLTGCSTLAWPRLSVFRLAVIMLLGGIVIELIQGLPVVGRDADIWDVVADMVGFVLGWVGATILRAGVGRSRRFIKE